jgi:hypothetical protein
MGDNCPRLIRRGDPRGMFHRSGNQRHLVHMLEPPGQMGFAQIAPRPAQKQHRRLLRRAQVMAGKALATPVRARARPPQAPPSRAAASAMKPPAAS